MRSDEREARAEEVFAEFLLELEEGEGEGPSLEALVQQHPDLAELLARHYAHYRRHADLQQALPRESAVPASDESAGAEVAEVLERLAGRPASPERYELGPEVGRGAMGVVYQAEDLDLQRSLAVKVLRAQRPRPGSGRRSDESVARARFLDEAKIAAQLDHPGIVPIHELGLNDSGELFFSMKLVKGDTLESVFEKVRRREGGWTVTRALGVLLKVCEAMAFAHDKGVIHRDLKPANIMVGRFGAVYVMDWGLARVVDREDRHDLRLRDASGSPLTEIRSMRARGKEGEPGTGVYTMDGDIVGTPAYMSPEQAAGKVGEMGPASDVYAVGAMLYSLLAGAMPYAEANAEYGGLAVVARVLQGPPRPVHELSPRTPPELVAICEKAMAREPQGRYASMVELGEDLIAYVETRVVKAYEAGAFAELKKWVRRNKAAAAGTLLLLTVVFAGLLWSRTVEARSRREIDLSTDLPESNYLVEQAADLWPAVPDRIPSMDRWLAQAEELLSRREVHEERLREAEESGDAVRLESQRAILGFLETLDPGEGGLVASVRERRAFAAGLEEASVLGAGAAEAWSEAIASIANPDECPAYGGLELTPQLGLVPLGRDPASGLWEFGHVASGKLAQRQSDGKLRITEDSGIVLVLVPGGTFRMGALRPDDDGRLGPNEDPYAAYPELNLHEVTLDPFFLSKYEMTQAQWTRVEGSNPSFWKDKAWGGRVEYTLTQPVETVQWEDCDRVARKLDLLLPTEAQWEYAARAGTTTIWWTGNTIESIQGAGNILDQDAKDQGAPAGWLYQPELRDGYLCPAPVGIFRANPFGLHDTLGNVWEWCREHWVSYDAEARPADGFRQSPDPPIQYLARGGAFYNQAVGARSSYRYEVPGFTIAYGLRPAREVRP